MKHLMTTDKEAALRNYLEKKIKELVHQKVNFQAKRLLCIVWRASCNNTEKGVFGKEKQVMVI